MNFDLVIRGGTLVDGTGREGVPGDLGIRNALSMPFYSFAPLLPRRES